MAGRYERVNAHDDEEAVSPIASQPRPTQPIPNSPPPSFHSRASSIISRDRNQTVNPDLADAFDESDDSDDEADDRQRLVRSNTSSGTSSAAQTEASSATSQPTATTQTIRPSAAAGSATRSTRVYGGGVQSDGVFANLMAKPERGSEAEKEELPPTYEQAAADAAPPYWETTILAPGMGGTDDVYVDGLPVGSFPNFALNAFITWLLDPMLIGFLLTYLLHSSHAAKNGSRAGLGFIFIKWGFAMKGYETGAGHNSADYSNPADPNAHDFDPNNVTGDDGGSTDISGSEWLGYLLMVVGWFILIRAVSDYLRAWRYEKLVRQSPDRGLGVPIIATGERPESVV